VRNSIGADSLGYISEEGMVAATEQPRAALCTACFTGDYPIPLPDDSQLGKNLFEPLPLDVEGVPTGVQGGADDALTRP
jgi:amidophosphoribosyltransferase